MSQIIIKADFHEVEDLAVKLATARDKTPKVRAAALATIGPKVFAEAQQIAAAYPSPLDELAGDLKLEGTPLFQHIYTSKREGWFLEGGSPNTGAPRPWLTGPAQKGADELFEELSKAADPW